MAIERASGQSPDTQYLRGLAYAGLKRREKALAAFNASLSMRPAQAAVLTARGKLQMGDQNLQAAIDDFKRAAELAPTPVAFLEEANAWRAAGKTREALQALDRGIALGGPRPELLEMALDIDVETGRWDSALERVDRLSELAPRPEPWIARRARLLARAGRAEQAKAEWRHLRDHLLGLPNLERGTPLLSGLLDESRAALGETVFRSRCGTARSKSPTHDFPAMIRLVLMLCAAASPSLVGQVSLTGYLAENFDSMGTGSAPPAGWFVIGQIPGDNDAWITGIPEAGNPSAASAGVTDNVLIENPDAGGGSVGSSNSKAFNLALAGSVTDRSLGTSPTSVAGIALEFRMLNDTGAAIGGLRVSYQIRRFSSAPLENQLPGYWLFYSMDGGVTWTNADSLNPQSAGGSVEVPNITGTTVVPTTDLWLPAPLAEAAELRLRWVDDNAQESSPDQILGLDSVTLEALPINGPPLIDPVSPADLSEIASSAVTLQVAVEDPEDDPLVVTFYGRPQAPAPGPDFTLMILPDTQYYSENLNNRFSQFLSQTNWIVGSRETLNTAFVAHMGDMVQNDDLVEDEWIRADQAMGIIENPATTLLPEGIPWGGAPGNHDGSGPKWNQYFGSARWSGRSYFQGNLAGDNTNNYQFFSASGIDFIVINLGYNPNPAGNQPVMDWADALLKAYPERRAIITSHWLVGLGSPAPWQGHGQAVYDNLKDNPNLFLMLSGHIDGEARRSDTFEGRTVHTILQDYQENEDGAGGGGSWLRYYIFSPANNTFSARTYRTTTDTYDTDGGSQFTLPYVMNEPEPWTALGTVSLGAGDGIANLEWTGLSAGQDYEWYAAVSDGVSAVGSPVSGFAAVDPPEVTITVVDGVAGEFGPDQELVFEVSRSGPTDSLLWVPLEFSGTALTDVDYAGAAGGVTIPVGQSAGQLVLTALQDDLAEGPEVLRVSCGASADFTTTPPGFEEGTIADKPVQEHLFLGIADAARRGALDDADDDGTANVVEYFFGTDAADAQSRESVRVPSAGQGEFVVRYPRAKDRPDVAGTLEWSGDLAGTWYASGGSNGTTSVVFTENVVSDPGADPEMMEATGVVSGSPAVLFVRLRIE